MEKKKQKKNKKKSYILITAVATVLCSILLIFTVSAINDINRLSKANDDLKTQLNVEQQKDAELQNILSKDITNDKNYIMNIAEKKLGYAMPGVRIFKDYNSKK